MSRDKVVVSESFYANTIKYASQILSTFAASHPDFTTVVASPFICTDDKGKKLLPVVIVMHEGMDIPEALEYAASNLRRKLKEQSKETNSNW